MWPSASERGRAHPRRVVLVGVPASRRTELFQAALSRAGAPAASVVSYTDLLGGRAFLPELVRPGAWVRIDSPGKDFETELALLKAGADAEDEEGRYARATRAQRSARWSSSAGEYTGRGSGIWASVGLCGWWRSNCSPLTLTT